MDGKYIFEGDIVKHRYSQEQGSNEIVWNEQEMCFELDNMDYTEWANHDWYESNKLEIISNIYEEKFLKTKP